MSVRIRKSFTAKTTATLMTALDTEKTDNGLDAVHIVQTSAFSGAAADYIVIFEKERL